MKKLISLILLAALCVGVALPFAACGESTDYTVGICQLMVHPSLDAATQGFIDALTAKMEAAGKTVTIDKQVAGDANLCGTVIGTLVAKNVDLIMANATPALTAAAAATSTIPVLGTSVTDYDDTFKNNIPANVGGTSDAVPFADQAQMMIDTLGLVEGDTVGVLYCSAETNSLFQYNAVKAYFESKGITATAYTFAETTDLQSVVSSAVNAGIKALYIPSDNTAAQNEAAIGMLASGANLPVYTSFSSAIGYASLAIDYYQLGYRTGEMAAEILLGNKTLADYEIEVLTPSVEYNEELCEALGITVPTEE